MEEIFANPAIRFLLTCLVAFFINLLMATRNREEETLARNLGSTFDGVIEFPREISTEQFIALASSRRMTLVSCIPFSVAMAAMVTTLLAGLDSNYWLLFATVPIYSGTLTTLSWIPRRFLENVVNEEIAKSSEQCAAPQIRPRWRVEG